MGIDLSLLWILIIFFGVMMYVVMDGFDLGIGMLFPFMPDRLDRDIMMNTVAPVWDGNETWLVLGGASLMAAFPLAYSVVLSALYLPLVLMLLGLIFRGVAFEFRFKANDRERPAWDLSFTVGSFVAAFFQGVALGAYIDGLPVKDWAFIGSTLGWFAPFPFFCGLGVVVAYTLLGSTWLILKTEGNLHARMKVLTSRLGGALLAIIAVISIWTPIAHPRIEQRWFNLPNLLWFAPVPLLVLLFSVLQQRAVHRDAHALPFLYTLALVFLGYSGLAISVWPNIVPPSISIWAAAAPPQSQGFALVGALFVIPFILMYTGWSYYVFRGKVRVGDGYH